MNVFGARQYSMRIWIDPDRAAEVNLTVDDVVAAIQAQNAQVVGGSVGAPPFNRGGTAFQLGIEAKGRLQSPEEFRDIIVDNSGNGKVSRMTDNRFTFCSVPFAGNVPRDRSRLRRTTAPRVQSSSTHVRPPV